MGGKLSYPHTDVPEDRTYLITGGNTGIGYQTAKSIAKLGGRVVIACRNEDKAKEAIEKMQKEHQEEVKKKRADEKEAANKEKAKAEKAAAAEKAKAEKAAAAEKAKAEKAAAAEKEKESASKKDESKNEEAKKEDGEVKKEEGGKEEEGDKDEGAKEDAPKEEAAVATEEAPKEEAAKEDTPKEDAPKEEEPKEDAAKSEEKPTEDGVAAGAAAEGENKEEEKKEEPEEPEAPIPALNVEYMIVDLASLESTMKFIEAYKAKGYPLHVLICNAGFGAGPKETSGDGYEMHFQVNYLSHFLMTLHLLPLLRQSAPNSRIVNVSSTLHTNGVFNLENVNGEQSYDRIKFYGNSKMYQIMSMYAFERRLKEAGISVFSVHPGYVDSEFNRGSADNKLFSFMDSLAGTFRLKRNVQDGAMTSLVASLDTSYDGKTGLYFKSCKPANTSALSRKQEHQEALWKFSVDLLKEKGHITDDLIQDLTLPEPEPQGESKPEDEANAEGAAGGGGDADGDEKKPEEAKEEKKKEDGGGDASEKKEEAPKEEEKKEEAPKEEEKKEEEKQE